MLLDKCKECGHIIANHEHRFRIEDEFQVSAILGPNNFNGV